MKRTARFLRVTLPGPPKRRGWRIKCDCGRSDDLIDGRTGEGEAEVARRFEQRGWRVGKSSHHTCPPCLAPKPPPVRSKVVTEAFAKLDRGVDLPPPVVTLKPPEPAMAAEPPPAATRENNRRIHEAIEERWNGARDCYLGSVSDAVIAACLDKPRAWVAAVREQFFGPDTCEARLDAAGSVADLEKRARELEAKGLELATLGEALRADVAKIRKSLAL